MASSKYKVGSFHTMRDGQIEILSYESCYAVRIRFTVTGHECTTNTKLLSRGSIKDPMKASVYGVGMIGVGSFSSRVNNKRTPMYEKWKDMLQRCYCEGHEQKFPSYSDCSVSEEWFNFQNFAQWYVDNHPNDGKAYHLDKDIKVPGNRVYGPDTCMFVSPEINQREAALRMHKGR